MLQVFKPLPVAREVHRLDAVPAASGTTPFMRLLSAFYVLLHRYTAEGDLCVGTPIANRHHLGVVIPPTHP